MAVSLKFKSDKHTTRLVTVWRRNTQYSVDYLQSKLSKILSLILELSDVPEGFITKPHMDRIFFLKKNGTTLEYFEKNPFIDSVIRIYVASHCVAHLFYHIPSVI